MAKDTRLSGLAAAIARALGAASSDMETGRSNSPQDVFDAVIDRLGDALATDPEFDRAAFVEACRAEIADAEGEREACEECGESFNVNDSGDEDRCSRCAENV